MQVNATSSPLVLVLIFPSTQCHFFVVFPFYLRVIVYIITDDVRDGASWRPALSLIHYLYISTPYQRFTEELLFVFNIKGNKNTELCKETKKKVQL